MKTEKGEFRFLHSSDYWNLRKHGDVLFSEDGLPDRLQLPEGGWVYLIVSDSEPMGGGLQEQPSQGTVKTFGRFARLEGRPLPWEEGETLPPAFAFIHPAQLEHSGVRECVIPSSRGVLPQAILDGRLTSVVVSEGQPEGRGFSSEPTEETVRIYQDRMSREGLPVPWL